MTATRLVQPEKQLLPILCTELPIVKDVNFEHSQPKQLAMLVTEFGITKDTRELQE